jgi:hypothetical protein
MKEKTLEYMAGLFDAEGCFNIARAFRLKTNCYNYIAQIIFTNTNEQLLKWVVKHFGGVYKKRKLISGNKQAYDWKITNQKHALSFISMIYPYLKVKKKEADCMMQYYNMHGQEKPEERDKLFLTMKDLKWNKSSVTTEVQDVRKIGNAYFAGFIDGDGHIDRVLSASNSNKNIIHLLYEKYGGHVYVRHFENPKWNDEYKWSLTNKKIVENTLLSWIPYLIDKRQKALETLMTLRTKIQSELIGNNESELMKTLAS